MQYSTIKENTAGRDGGGMYLAGENAVSYDNVINNNIATRYGGGIYLAENIDYTLSTNDPVGTSSYFILGNKAEAGGGVYMEAGSELTVLANIMNNTATTNGGGVAANEGCNLRLGYGSMSGNTAQNGGGVYMYAEATKTPWTGEIYGPITTYGNTATNGIGPEFYLANGSFGARNKITLPQTPKGIYLCRGATFEFQGYKNLWSEFDYNPGVFVTDNSDTSLGMAEVILNIGYFRLGENNGTRTVIKIGYFDKQPMEEDGFVFENKLLLIDENTGDQQYNASYPWAVYELYDGFTFTPNNNIIYDGLPLDLDTDFEIRFEYKVTTYHMFCSYRLASETEYTDGLPVVAGDYNVRIGCLTLDHGKQVWYYEKSSDLTIHQATPAYTVPTGIMAITGVPLADIPLPDGWSWKDGTIVPQAAGTATYAAIYDLGNPNYATVEEDVTVTVVNASSDTHHENWQRLQADGTISGGTENTPMRYYLTQDTERDTGIVLRSGYAVLCLNGYKLTRTTGTGMGIVVKEGAHLTVCDCKAGSQESEHRHKYYVADNGQWIFYDGDLPAEAPEGATTGILWGGVITGSNSGGIGVESNATFNLQSGKIAGNSSRGSGGGIYVAGNGIFNMSGGEITGNSSGGNGGGIYVYSNGIFNMSGGLIHANTAAGGNELSTYGASTITGGTIDGTIRRTAGGILFQGGYHNITELYYGSGNRPQVTGGYFTGLSYDQVAPWVISGYTMLQVDALFGDSDYREGYPWAVYALDETRITATVADHVAYDGEPVAQGEDFTLAGTDGLAMKGYTYTPDGTDTSLDGLPADAGAYTIATAGFDDAAKTYCTAAFALTIGKGEWTGVKTVEGTITPGTDGSVSLPAVPDGAAFGTPAGDPEVENIAITGNVLGYTGGSGIENGKTYTVTVPVGETANYLAYDITVSLTGDTGSGLAQTAAGALRVFGTDGMLHITGTAAEAAVYDVRGLLVYRGTARTIHLPAGVYIVRAEEQVRKAVVK